VNAIKISIKEKKGKRKMKNRKGHGVSLIALLAYQHIKNRKD
jgi:hypothetical protein